MSKKESQPARVPDLKQGEYSDGSPLDEVHYLECKLILKPDRFTSAEVFFEYRNLVARTAKEFSIGFRDDGGVLKPKIREVVFWDTGDFRLYNHSFILRRRIAYKDGFPEGEPKNRFQVSPSGHAEGRGAGHAAEDCWQLPDQVQGRGPTAEGSGGRLPVIVLPQRAISLESVTRRRSHVIGYAGARVS